MDLYKTVSYDIGKLLTRSYSSSFGSSSRLLPRSIRPHIYAIYGLVRIADEIVDTYRSKDAGDVLTNLEHEVYDSLDRQYSANPVVHAFVITAKEFGIAGDLIAPFFDSMRMDLSLKDYNQARYEAYIYGSAEVVGLMCLRVFVKGDSEEYNSLESGARALGSAYQKVNFLRDMAADYKELGRSYIPNIEFDSFDDSVRDAVIHDIEKDFSAAAVAMEKLPKGVRLPVKMSQVYYTRLLAKIGETPAEQIKQKRVRISALRKFLLLIKTVIGETLRVR